DAAAPVFADATLDANVGHVAPIHDLAEPLVMRQNSEATDAMALADGAARVDASISAASSMAVEGTTDETELSAAALVTTNESERDMTGDDESTDQTRLVRGVQKPGRDDYFQEPVVAWLVVIGGPGLGAFRPVYEGNNALGRAPTQRIAIDFGDDAISAEEQAYIRYDSTDRTFLFVPNLAKTNVVSLNETKPTSAVPLTPMDVITVGKTQLVFVPFCGPEFDWSELKAIGSGGA
ncbi:MAG: FHA domain-containing protein, partial [Pseudomonadota bacterium]